MVRAKEGSRTPTRVTPLEPERTASVRVRESSSEVRPDGCASVVTHNAAGDRGAPQNSGARTGIQIGEKRVGPGVRARVTAGLAKGLEGLVLEQTKVPFGDVPTFAIELPMPLGVRVIRADYLEVAS